MVQTIEWNTEQVRDFWDFYSQYPELYFTYQYGDRIVETIWPYVSEGKNVLDFGCGTGFLLKHFVNKPVKIYGTDSSSASRDYVNTRFKEVKNFEGAFSIEEILSDKKFEGFFDVVCLIEVVEHLTDIHMDNVLKSIRRLIKTNGRLIITTPNEEDLSASYVYCPESKKVFHRWQHVRSWSAQLLDGYLRPYGYTPERIFTCDFSAPPKRIRLRSFLKKTLVKTGLIKKRTEANGPHLVYVGVIL